MYCIHCKYSSFDYLPSCPRCGKDWTETKKALNLDWVVASAPERMHQRQAPENEAELPVSVSLSGSDQPRRERPRAGHEAQSSSPQLHLDTQKRSQMHDRDAGEDELDFPDLDTLLQPQSASQSPDQSPAEAPNPADMQGPKEADPRGPSAEESDKEEILDLSSLVHDLGLEVDESETSENKPHSAPPGSERKFSNSSQG